MSDIGKPMEGDPTEIAMFLLNIGEVLDKTYEFIDQKFVNVVTIEGNVFVELYGMVRLKLEDMPTLLNALNGALINRMGPPGMDGLDFASPIKDE